MSTRSLQRQLIGGTLALLLAVFAVPTAAQNPEKFERVVPPKPQPAAPRAAPAKPAPGPPAAVPTEQQPLVVELKRKAVAKEAENGFCAGTGWPMRKNDEAGRAAFAAFLDQAVEGNAQLAVTTYDDPPPRCNINRVAAVFVEGGRRCLQLLIWDCTIGGPCGYGSFKYCRKPDGLYEYSR